MSYKYSDSYDACSSSGDLTKRYPVVGTGWVWSSGAGRFGGGAASNDGTHGSGQALAIPSNIISTSDCGIGIYFKASTTPASLLPFVQWPGEGSIRLNSSGNLVFYNNNDSSARFTTTANYCDNKYHWIDYRVAAGRFTDIYVDNVRVVASIGGGSNAMTTFQLVSISGVALTVDDLILYDDSAGWPNSNSADFPLLARQITVTRPTSDGTCNFATLSSGVNHYSLVNEVSPDGDTSYVEDGTSGHQDLLNMGALGYTPAVINAAVASIYVENPVGGTITLSAVCKSNVTTTAATAKTTPLTYGTQQFAFTTDPNTSAAWGVSGLNAAQFGYKNP